MKLGILGAGNIAGVMAATVNKMNSTQCLAVSARSYEKALEFAKKYDVEKAYGSYEEMLSDPEIDLVYVATPHSHHYEHMKLCLKHNKNVLCEKAFTVNAAEAKEILTEARQKGLLVTEAIWTRYIPMRKKLEEVMESGVIGEITSLTANLGYVVGHLPRMESPKLAGGALLDLGVYPINFALMAFSGEIQDVSSTAVLTNKGVDRANSITITFSDGKMAVLHSNMMVATDRRGMIFGSKGYIEFLNVNNCEGIRVFDTQHKLLGEYETPTQISGYEYEVEACRRAIENKEPECFEMPHAETIRVMELMDSLRREWGVSYPNDQEG